MQWAWQTRSTSQLGESPYFASMPSWSKAPKVRVRPVVPTAMHPLPFQVSSPQSAENRNSSKCPLED